MTTAKASYESRLIAACQRQRGRTFEDAIMIVLSDYDWYQYWPEIDQDGRITGNIVSCDDLDAYRGVGWGPDGQMAPNDRCTLAMQII